MSTVDFRLALNRNTKCYRLRIGGLHLCISYDTIIAAQFGNKFLRRDNEWGKTTGRHMNELGVREWQVGTEEEIETLVREAMISMGHEMAMSRLEGNGK